MTYEAFEHILSKEKFVSKYKPAEVTLTKDIEDRAYNKYVVKCKVLQRDEFMCQNINCGSKVELTMHHVKLQKNGGKNTVRNCVTVCDSCHKAFHSAKIVLAFDNHKLPPHIDGHLFRLSENDAVNWKKLKKELKKFRRSLRDEANYCLSTSEMIILFNYLFKIQNR